MIVTPQKSTLRKYGLTLGDFAEMLRDQGGKCALCDKCPKSGRYVVDHFHVPGWKKMPPEMRRRWVRGLLCNHCNHRLVGQFMTLAAAERIVEYLGRFEQRRCTIAVLFDHDTKGN